MTENPDGGDPSDRGRTDGPRVDPPCGGQRPRPAIPVPWFAWRTRPGDEAIALRPVPEDEIEELDELGPLDGWVTDPRPPVVPREDRLDGAALVSRALGRAVKAHRWSLHLTQEAYGRRTGRRQGTVSHIENGHAPLSVADLVDLAVETGRSVRIDVFPDDGAATAENERIDVTTFGMAGSVRIAVGAAPVVRPAPTARSTPRRPGPIS